MSNLKVKASLSLALVGLLCSGYTHSKPSNTQGERKDNFKIYSRVSQNYRDTTREIATLPAWNQFQSIVFPVYFGTPTVQVLGPEKVQCDRCNDNPISEATLKLKSNCTASTGVSEQFQIPTASRAIDKSGKKLVMKDTFWIKKYYECESNPFAKDNTFHVENRLTVTSVSGEALKPFLSKQCTFSSDTRGFRIEIGGNAIVYPWASKTSHVSTKEFVDVPHPDDKWFRPMGRYRSEVIEFNDLFVSQDQLDIALPMPISNAVPEALDYAYVRTADRGFLRVVFEQNAVISLNSYLPQSNSFFSCAVVPGLNGFTGQMQFNRID